MGFDKRETAKKYLRREGDTLEVIAQRETEAGNELTGEELAKFNFGAADRDTVNECLRDELGCRKRDSNNNLVISAEDEGQGELLIPQRFRRSGLPTDKTHTLRVVKKSCPPQFLECLAVPGITFEFDKSFVRPSVVHHLKAVEAAAARHPEARIMIFGHTDKVGSEPYNKGLSERRAKSVYAFIINDTDTWESLYQQENWGVRILQIILADLGHDPGTIDGDMGPNTVGGMQSFLALPEGSSVANNAAFRKQLFAAYMSGKHDIKLTPDRFMDPKHMGCSEFNPVEDTEWASEPNRRVMFYLFHKDRLPKLPCRYATLAPCYKQMTPPSPRYRATFGCSFYDSIAHKCPCERAIPPEVVEFFGRPADHDHRPERPHNLVVPEGSSVTLHWTVVLTHQVEIKGTAIDNSTCDLALPNDGATDNPDSLSTGQVTIRPSLDSWYRLTAFNRGGQTIHHQTVMVTLFPSDRPADQLSVRAAGDVMGLSTASPGPDTPDVVMYGREEADVVAGSPPNLQLGGGVPHAKDLMMFWPAHISTVGIYSPKQLRAYAAAIVKTFNGFGIGTIKTDVDPPVGRNLAYADILFTWAGDERRNKAYSTARGVSYSSCALVVRSLWLLLGARHRLLIPYENQTAIENPRAFAILCGAYRGKVCWCLREPVKKKWITKDEIKVIEEQRGYKVKGGGPNDKWPLWDEFNPQSGDVIFLNHPDPKNPSQHVLTVTEIEKQKDETNDTYIQLIGCDGGQRNANAGLGYEPGQTDDTCHAIKLKRRLFEKHGTIVHKRREDGEVVKETEYRVRPRGDISDRVVSGWADVTKLDFAAPITWPWRNYGNLNLPEPEVSSQNE